MLTKYAFMAILVLRSQQWLRANSTGGRAERNDLTVVLTPRNIHCAISKLRRKTPTSFCMVRCVFVTETILGAGKTR